MDKITTEEFDISEKNLNDGMTSLAEKLTVLQASLPDNEREILSSLVKSASDHLSDVPLKHDSDAMASMKPMSVRATPPIREKILELAEKLK